MARQKQKKPRTSYQESVMEEMKERERKHLEKKGKLPSSREIDKAWEKVAQSVDNENGW